MAKNVKTEDTNPTSVNIGRIISVVPDPVFTPVVAVSTLKKGADPGRDPFIP